MTDREKRIREIAHHLWVQEGRPEGRSDSHWQEAVALYEAEGAQSKDARAKPPAEPAAEKPARSDAKKTAEATAGKKTTAEPNAQKPASAGKPSRPNPPESPPKAGQLKQEKAAREAPMASERIERKLAAIVAADGVFSVGAWIGSRGFQRTFLAGIHPRLRIQFDTTKPLSAAFSDHRRPAFL